MSVLLKKLLRELVMLAVCFLPAERRTAIDRRLRGWEDYRRLQRADAVMVSFGKSGRTWLRVMLSRFYQLKHGLAERHMLSFDNLHRKQAAIPRILFTHDNYLQDYTGNADNKDDYQGRKVVLLVRHPADVAVSQFHQWKYRMRGVKKRINDYPDGDLSLDQFVLGDQAGLPKVIDWMNDWAAALPRLEQVLVVRYEDLRRDTDEQLRRITAFIGTPGSVEQIREAVEYAAYDNMKQREANNVFWWSRRLRAKDRSNPNSFKVRRAKVGGYRDDFSAEQLATMDSMIRDRLDPMFGYRDSEQPQVANG